MFVVNPAISVAAVVVFYLLIARFRLVRDPFSSALVFLFFPPRWFLYRSIGASEPLFLLLTLLMLYFLKKDEATKSTLLGAFTTLTRIWGIITFPVLIGVWLWNKKLTVRRFALALAIPASLLLLFSL
jgi:Gpi18-like mannosyltransferase